MRLFAVCLLASTFTGCTPVASSIPRTVPSEPPGVSAPQPVRQVAVALQSDYARGDWNAVRSVVTDRGTAANLVGEMKLWKAHDITDLTAAVVYTQRLAPGRYEATVRFASDPRAIPDFEFFAVQVRGRTGRVTGTDPGLSGTSYARADWEVTRTQHFVVYHSPYQLQGADKHYLADIEYQRAQFAAKFHVRLPPLAAYYLYPTQPLMGRLTGRCGANPGEIGCTLPLTHPPTIHGMIQATFHEPIHVYELALTPPPTAKFFYTAPHFINEGTAVALQDREADPRLSDYCSDLAYAPLDDCARQAMADVNPMSLLSDPGFNHADPGDAYSLGGSFVKYLILRYGYPRFGRFYYKLAAQPNDHVADYNVASRGVYQRTIAQLIGAWKGQLCSAGC